jgi:hypothetical protein
VRYYWLNETRLSTYHLTTPGTDNYHFSQLLPIKVYLASVAVTLLLANKGLEWTPQTLIITGYTEYSFFLGYIVLTLG